MPIGLPNFDWQPRTRLIYGAGCVERVGEVVRELGARPLLVTDPGLVKAGHADHVRRVVPGVTVYDRCRENPTTRDVEACVAVAHAAKIDLIVALGGGSSLDTAKGCNFILTNGGRMQDYWGVGKATKPMLPLIAIPTTAGTGSECQSFALIADETTHQKMACGDPKAAARVAILDPTLTMTQPPKVTAATGLDAIAHAVETAVTKKQTALSAIYSREAFRLLAPNLPVVLREPDNLAARAAMQLGAAWAGTAIENSMLGAAHSCANPLTARHGVMHGAAVSVMLPHVVRFNADPRYAELAPDLPALLTELLGVAGIPARLRDHGVPREALPALAAEAAQQWTAQFNPRPITVADCEGLYDAAW
jgi:alcohol dehydrogenase